MELEQKIQTKIIKRLRLEGWLCLKIIKLSASGFPDVLAHRGGETMYIEVKRPNGKLSEIQKLRIQELREKGIEVKIWEGYNINFIQK